LEAVATSPQTLALATADGLTDWREVLADCPRGDELSDRARESLDRIALEFSDSVPLEALLDAFEVRFDQDLRAIAAVDGVSLDHHGVRSVWRALVSLPSDGVTADVVRWHVPGDQFDADLEARLEPDDGEEETPPPAPAQRAPASESGPAHWRRFDTVRFAVDAFVGHAGGDEALQEAAMEFLLGGGGDAMVRWRAAVKAAHERGALAANPSQVEIALVRLRDALPDEPGLGGVGVEHGSPRPALTAPTAFAGWTEYFAAVVSRAGESSSMGPRPTRLPSWLTAARATGLVEED